MKKNSVNIAVILLAVLLMTVSCGRTGPLPSPDKTPPTVISIIPTNGEQDVAINISSILVTFSEAMDPATINEQTITLILVSENRAVSGSVSYASNNTAVFKPTSLLNPMSKYKLIVNGSVADEYGNVISTPCVSYFTTGSSPNNTSPYVITDSVIPPDNSDGIGVNTPISVTFSTQMNALTLTPSNITMTDGSTLTSLEITYYDKVAFFRPSTPLKNSTKYAIKISKEVSDLAGNKMSADFIWSFMTEAPTPDTLPPSVLFTLPDSNEMNVPVYKQIVVSFSETMLSSSVTSTTFILADQNGAAVSGQITCSGATAVFTPSQALSYVTRYTATITSGVSDLTNNNMGNSYVWNFTTEAQPTYTITAGAGVNGSIIPSGAVSVNENGNQTFTIKPNDGYQIANVLVDDVSLGAMSSYTFTKVTNNHTISASFVANTATYTVTPSAGANGTITPDTPQTVSYNATPSFIVAANTGYYPVMGGTCGGSLNGDTYTTNPVTGDCTVIANFAANTYLITATAGPNGTISPLGTVSVNEGMSQTFIIAPNNTNYRISAVIVDGADAGLISSYTFSNVTSNHTISASFEPVYYTITTSAGPGGSISPTTLVQSGTNSTVSITPDPNYHVLDVLVDGVSKGAVTSYLFTNVTADHTISASFAANSTPICTVTPSSGGNGSISPDTPQTVDCNSTLSFVLSPNPGFSIDTVTGTCGGTLSGDTYTTNAITADCTVIANFTNSFTINATAGPNGSIDPAGAVTVGYDGTQTFTITPDANYSIADVLVDGVSAGPVTTFTFANVTANHTISATFGINYLLTVTKTGTGSGTVTDDKGLLVWDGDVGSASYLEGTTVLLTASAVKGSNFDGWTGCDITSGPHCTVNMTGAKNVTARFR